MRWLAAAVLLAAAPAAAAERPDRLGDRPSGRWGAALSLGQSYGPTGAVRFQAATLLWDRDYGAAWGHPAPASLRFKLEATAGVAEVPQGRFLAAVNGLAVRAVDPWATPRFRPYVEAGIGAIYTDFRCDGQGLRWNFNPLIGLGAEFLGEGRSAFLALRGHHVSNGGLHADNAGINSLVLTAGTFW